MSEQTAVITGASGSIGAAIADNLAEEGVRLRLVGRNESILGAVAQRVANRSPQVLSYRCDLTIDEELEVLTTQIRRDSETLNILVHCAGIIALAPFETASVADLDQQYRTNVRAPYILTQSLLSLLRAQRGSVVFINSSAVLSARAGISQYAATKHALKAVADGLRAEVNNDGIRVLTVYPGRTAGQLQADIHEVEGKQYAPESLMQPEDIARIVVDALKISRTAEVTDIMIRPMRNPH